MPINLYNSLTRKKEEFHPLDPNNVKMYVCGPTVYDRAHLGNARSVVVYDVLFRLLKHFYPKVTYVRNITDVDDKIMQAAKERNIPIPKLTKEMIGFFNDDMKALNVLKPTFEPKATENIDNMVRMIEKLIKNKKAYAAQGHVLFSVSSFPDYGKLSGRTRDEMIAGARVEVAPFKNDPADFVLWKPMNMGDDPSAVFDSPWGTGRPGWHIECSAMSTTLLTQDFDIHGGGADLMFPHHENEMAQSCSANPGSHYAKYWVHNGFLTVNGEKMSKSIGNFITVKDLLDKGVKGEVIRYALLSSHYRSPLDWTDKLLEDAQKTMDKFYRVLLEEKANLGPDGTMSDDLGDDINLYVDDMNLSQVFAKIHMLASPPYDARMMKKMMNLLGLLEQNPEEWFKNASESDKVTIQKLIDERTAAKNSKNFQLADQIRKQLADMGILLEDKPDGTTDWRKV